MELKKIGKCYVLLWDGATASILKCDEYIDKIENKKLGLTFVKTTKPLYLTNKRKRLYFAYTKIAYTVLPYNHYDFLQKIKENSKLPEEFKLELNKKVKNEINQWIKENPETITRNNDTSFIQGFQRYFKSKFDKFISTFLPIITLLLGMLLMIALGYFGIISIGTPPEPVIITVPTSIPEALGGLIGWI